jgi:hypothetical protein
MRKFIELLTMIIPFLDPYPLWVKSIIAIWIIGLAVITVVLIFTYPTNMSKNSIKDKSPVNSQTNIGKVEGDYVAGDKNVTNIYKPEISPEEKEKLEKESDPLVAIRIDKKDKELFIKIKAKKHVATLAMEIPILGRVVNIHDYNSIADAQTHLKQITGSQTTNSQNNVEFLIENIKPNVDLSYKVIFEPMSKGIYIAGCDRYKISYTWEFEGNILSREKWISFETGKEVEGPTMQVMGASIYNRALTPDEIKKLYEQGPPKHKIE